MRLCLLSTIPPTFLPQKLGRKCSLQISCTGFGPYVMLPLNSRMVVTLAAPLTECTGLSWWGYSWEEKPSEGSEAAQLPGSSCAGLHPGFQKLWQRGWAVKGRGPWQTRAVELNITLEEIQKWSRHVVYFGL